jgi:hypothetical protein
MLGMRTWCACSMSTRELCLTRSLPENQLNKRNDEQMIDEPL